MKLLEGRRGIVLGVSGERSAGFALAVGLRAMGAEIAATFRPGREAEVGPRLEAAGVPQRFAVEATDEGTWRDAFDALDRAWDGRLDFVVHTMAHAPAGLLARPLVELERSDFSAVLDASVYSLITAARHAAPRLERSPAGRLVTLTSASSHLMTPNYHAMGIAKGALDAAVLYLAQELGPRRIACNAVSFSLVPTDGAVRVVGAEAAEGTRRHLAKRAPSRTPVELEHVVSAVGYLCSPLCANVTGEILQVDGGFSRTYF